MGWEGESESGLGGRWAGVTAREVKGLRGSVGTVAGVGRDAVLMQTRRVALVLVTGSQERGFGGGGQDHLCTLPLAGKTSGLAGVRLPNGRLGSGRKGGRPLTLWQGMHYATRGPGVLDIGAAPSPGYVQAITLACAGRHA